MKFEKLNANEGWRALSKWLEVTTFNGNLLIYALTYRKGGYRKTSAQFVLVQLARTKYAN